MAPVSQELEPPTNPGRFSSKVERNVAYAVDRPADIESKRSAELGYAVVALLCATPFGHAAVAAEIDRLADDHPLHRDLRGLFAGGHRRYAGIVVDIGLDHALACTWRSFNDEPLAAFAARLCAQLIHEWPTAALGRDAPARADFERLLTGYSNASGMKRALAHVEQRLRRPADLVPLAETVVTQRARFERAIGPVLDDLLSAIEQLPPDPA